MTPDQIVTRARNCLGTPFQHQGRLPGIALDCAGLAVHVASEWHTPTEPRAYGRLPHEHQLEKWIDAQPYLTHAPKPQAGDVLLMRFVREPQHVAICAGQTIIHSYQRAGKVVEHNLDHTWRKRIVAVYRFQDIEA
jgi:cell wall-associated NlpC family hydrolase